MSTSCGTCVCTAAARTCSGGRLVLATQVDHTATALRTLALRRGAPLRVLGPGLLELRSDAVDAFLSEARHALSSVEADEVRCLVVDGGLPEPALLAAAMGATSLSAAGARVESAHLLPLFDDEHASFHAVYQPIVDLRSGRTVAHEALLRATDPSGAAVYPDVLFPAAEAAGWTHVLDRIGRTTALHDAGPWLGDDQLFINFVPTSIYRPEVCLRTTEQAAERAGLSLHQLVFEVTETHRVTDLDHLDAVFAYYRRRGCRVALDDLGAGYSSLNMLVRLQPDVVKLDKEIVQGLPDPVSASVVAAIVSITHAYGGQVLAECVETPEQAAAALDLGVDLAQGWHFGRPVRPAAEAPRREPAAVVTPTRPDAAVALAGDVPALPPAVVDDLLARAVASSASGVVVTAVDGDMPLVHVNVAFERMTGRSAQELLGRNCRILQGAGTDREAVARVAAAVRAGQEHTSVLLNYRKDGTPWWNELHLSPLRDDAGRITHYVGFQHDVTDRVRAEEQLLHLSTHDGLTGLLNRSALLEQLDLAVAHAGSRAVAVLFLDLDGFKAVNDTHGHAVGDRVLAEVAGRLRSALRTGDLLARHGGDEFVAVLLDLDPLDAERVVVRAAGDLQDALGRPVTVGGRVLPLGASVGTALLARDGSTGSELLRAADGAMYRAKTGGRLVPEQPR